MKKFLLLPVIMIALTLCGLVEATQTETVQLSQEPKFIEETLRDYNKGKYNTFLKKTDENYKESNKNWEYNTLLDERKHLSTIVQEFDSPTNNTFKKNISLLEEQKYRELVEFCLLEPNSKLSREVKDMVFFTPNQHEQESLDYLAHLNWKFKGDGETPVENKLIDLDIEFWLKSLSLNLLLTQNKIEYDTYKKQYAVLQLEKLNQMQLATEEPHVDSKIKDYIKTAQKIYPKVQAANMTKKFLNDLAIGKIQPQNERESAVKIIATKYHEKELELTKKHFPEDQK